MLLICICILGKNALKQVIWVLQHKHIVFFLPINNPQWIFFWHNHISDHRRDSWSIKVHPFWKQFLDGGLNKSIDTSNNCKFLFSLHLVIHVSTGLIYCCMLLFYQNIPIVVFFFLFYKPRFKSAVTSHLCPFGPQCFGIMYATGYWMLFTSTASQLVHDQTIYWNK